MDKFGGAHGIDDLDRLLLGEPLILPSEEIKKNRMQQILHSEVEAHDETSHDFKSVRLQTFVAEIRITSIDVIEIVLQFFDLQL